MTNKEAPYLEDGSQMFYNDFTVLGNVLTTQGHFTANTQHKKYRIVYRQKSFF